MKTLTLFFMIATCLNTTLRAQTDSSKKKFRFVEVMPKFPGDLSTYLSENIRYPRKARRNNVEGLVLTRFIVDTLGFTDSIKIIKSVHPLLDSETVRLVKNMPKWEPGIQFGKKVRVVYTLPISFKINRGY